MDDENGSLLGYLLSKLLPAAAILASYWILSRLPEEFTFSAWVAFVVSAVLFCLGFFPLAADLTDENNEFRSPALSVGMILFSAAMTAAGTLYVYKDDGSERSLGAAVLLLIEGITVFGMADNRVTGSTPMRFLLRLLAVGTAALSVYLFAQFIIHENGHGQIEAGVMLCIESILLFSAKPKGER